MEIALEMLQLGPGFCQVILEITSSFFRSFFFLLISTFASEIDARECSTNLKMEEV